MIVFLSYTVAFGLLAVAAGAATLAVGGPGSGWLAAHLPAPVLRKLRKLADWFDARDTDPHRDLREFTRFAQEHAKGDPGVPSPPAPLPVVRDGPPPTGPTAGRFAGPTAGTLVPPDHAAAHARIATFDPETDAELLAFYGAEAAGFAGYGEAFREHADLLLHEIGLDPAFTHVAAQVADDVADLANAFAFVTARLSQVYGAVQQEVAGGLVLPWNAREWLTGEGTA